jgi:hypothetical protein
MSSAIVSAFITAEITISYHGYHLQVSLHKESGISLDVYDITYRTDES